MTYNPSLKDVIAYILKKYPYDSDLSDARITKMIYLADWKKAVQFNEMITDIKWYYNNYGPYVEDVMQTVNNNSDLFEVKYTQNAFGGRKKEISLKDKNYQEYLSENDRKIIDKIVEITKNKNFTDFKKLVYNTYPIVFSNQYEHLDLIKLAAEYRKLMEEVRSAKNKDLKRINPL